MTPTILIVEDNTDLADNLKELMQTAGYAAVVAVTCAEARTHFTADFNVALIDARLPDGNGMNLIAPLKKAQPQCEVILLTGYTSVSAANDVLRQGAWAYLSKPFSSPGLLQAVEQATRHSRIQRENALLVKRAAISERVAAAGMLTTGLSHEIRNPLNAASLQLSVLERRIKKTAGVEASSFLEPLTLARDEIRRLDQLLDEFLQLARPGSASAQHLDLKVLLLRVGALFAETARERGRSLSTHADPELWVLGDETKVQQVVTNLIINALDAVGEGGQVSVSGRRDGQQVLVEVVDDGPGISAEVARHIFEPFFTTKPKGTGLGLPISHSICMQLGGDLRFEPNRPKGTRFIIALPWSP